jgi:hypothetical protein
MRNSDRGSPSALFLAARRAASPVAWLNCRRGTLIRAKRRRSSGSVFRICLDEYLDGLLARVDVDTNGRIAKIHLVSATILSPDDGVGHVYFRSPSLALQTAVGLRIDGTKIALVPGTEPQLVVFCEILEARVHPVDADPRFLGRRDSIQLAQVLAG